MLLLRFVGYANRERDLADEYGRDIEGNRDRDILELGACLHIGTNAAPEFGGHVMGQPFRFIHGHSGASEGKGVQTDSNFAVVRPLSS